VCRLKIILVQKKLLFLCPNKTTSFCHFTQQADALEMWKAENRIHGISPGSDSGISRAQAPPERPKKNVLIIFLVVMVCIAIEHIMAARMPQGIPNENDNTFMVSNTRKYLQDLTAIGPKVTGEFSL
jgi:hypothetical protein